MQPAKTLRVWANPYAHVDHEGRPCGALRVMSVEGATQFEFVGAQHVAVVMERDKKNVATRQDTWFEF